MAWTLFRVPREKKGELDAVLRDDALSRQSQKVREGSSAGGPAGSYFVLVEGASDAVRRADELLLPIGEKLPASEAEDLYRKFKDEEDAASAGMGLFFTE